MTQKSGLFRKKVEVVDYQGIPVAKVTSVNVESNFGGAIVRASGVPTQQGAFDVRLIDATVNNDVMTLTLAAVQPAGTPQGTENSRRVETGRYFSDQELGGVRTIRVISTTNSVSARR